MKRMKKIFAVILSLAMVMGMSLTALATEPESPHIKITGLPKEQGVNVTIKYKKIVEPKQATPEDTTGWKLVDGITLGKNVTLADLLAVEGTQDAANGTVNSNENVAKAISGISFGNEDTYQNVNVTEDGSYTISNVTPGLYVIEVDAEGYTFIRMMAFVDYDATETVVTAKGEKNQVGKKINEDVTAGSDSSVSVTNGDRVPFEVTAMYPFYDANTNSKKFIISDTVTGGKIADSGITVQIGDAAGVTVAKNQQAADSAGFTVTWNTGSEGFSVNFNPYSASNAGKEVKITYNVDVEVSTTVDKLTNDVTSTTTVPDNDPDSETGEKDNITEARVISPSVKAQVKKVGEGENPEALSGAKFTLYVEVTEEAEEGYVYVPAAGNKVAEIVKKDNKSDNENWVKKVTESNETGTDGLAKFENLDAEKTYYVVETQAPTGYTLNKQAFKLTGATFRKGDPEKKEEDGKVVMVTTNTATDFTGLDDTTNQNISDTKLSSLPSTGGIGTTIFTIGGCAIMIIAAALFFASRRKEAK